VKRTREQFEKGVLSTTETSRVKATWPVRVEKKPRLGQNILIQLDDGIQTAINEHWGANAAAKIRRY
jgi:hypothetical protein